MPEKKHIEPSHFLRSDISDRISDIDFCLKIYLVELAFSVAPSPNLDIINRISKDLPFSGCCA